MVPRIRIAACSTSGFKADLFKASQVCSVQLGQDEMTDLGFALIYVCFISCYSSIVLTRSFITGCTPWSNSFTEASPIPA